MQKKDQCQIFQRAIDAWGIPSQEEQCVEECAELIVAIKHVHRSSRKSYFSSDMAAVISEMADVTIMLEQMKLIYGEDNFNSEYERKLKRLEANLDAKSNDLRVETNMTSNDIPEEFPKKLEDRVCQYWQTCAIRECKGHQPHIENHECGLGHQPLQFYHKTPCARSKPCIQIHNMWLDKGGN